ncbi:Chorismate synthase [Methanosarcina siciliae C2J]|uniref:Chorismate synthase n=1 Tax=Methanosarcina siciliae C2J TaxID=1434118 RepID=A0A0E3PK74_9EURY|nr:chorismate synthase [Methanosarcina siciliae]AKB35069.1 Chorismate synthase [Methanosarcina siciliae C2J]
MAGNIFGQMFRITTWGESHGRAVGVVVDGLPAGLCISEADIQKELDKRRPGQSEVSTPRSEADRVEILSGIFEGMSTGTPISMLVWNSDARSSSYDAIKNTPRPGHADFTYMARYGIRDHRGGGRSSARETIGRVAGGALAKLLLSSYGIQIAGHVLELGGIRAKPLSFEEILENVEKTPVRCADLEAAEKMLEKVAALWQERDSVGGIVELIVKGVPAGLGEPVFDRLDADIAKALMSIPAVKGFEIGAGFEVARMRGSEMNDPFRMEEGEITCSKNNAGGILGGISSGLDIVCRAAVKPTPSIGKVQQTVDLTTMENTEIAIKGRHDPTIPPRMVPVAEAMVALVLADHMLRSGFINSRTLLE